MRETSAKRNLFVPKHDRMANSAFGRFCELCHEKGSELEDGYPEEKMKGRSVLLGDIVKDQDFSWAGCCELGSSPPSMEAAKALDAMGSLPG